MEREFIDTREKRKALGEQFGFAWGKVAGTDCKEYFGLYA